MQDQLKKGHLLYGSAHVVILCQQVSGFSWRKKLCLTWLLSSKSATVGLDQDHASASRRYEDDVPAFSIHHFEVNLHKYEVAWPSGDPGGNLSQDTPWRYHLRKRPSATYTPKPHITSPIPSLPDHGFDPTKRSSSKTRSKSHR